MSDNYIPSTKPYARNGEVVVDTIWPEKMHRIALGIEYKGTDYHGFQVQPNGVKTVQQALEKALSIVADEPVSLVCAGRTDAGVHATNQVIHFDTLAIRPDKAWLRGTRPHLPDSVCVRWAKEVTPQFHARFSATNRTYRYLITDANTASGLLFDQVTWSSRPLSVAAMSEAAAYLVGQHDFTSFRATQCQAKSPVRRIEYFHIVRRGNLILIEVQANAFLHHMVRNMVGALMAVGAGDKPACWIAEALAERNRSAAGVTAKPFGLYLVGVDYPSGFGLPRDPPGPLFIADPLGTLAL